ncbi:TonB-dependent receptor [Sphingobium sp. TKS]|uniref:TonB-dependent receptor n=1 Tax=Sphingobium sp. TKS TaxID=1315974 RepID=UPI0007704A20|nr:TonB-dependent receptor [Sphingobium sp. TKS]AMK25581.1 TonB-dependent receptor [Sphingobium sp. TKS]
MTFKVLILSGVSLAVLPSAAFGQQASPGGAEVQAVPAAQSAPNGWIQDIIVTARKRAELSQNVPVSITAFNPEILAEKRIVSVTDVANNTSGLTLQASTTTQQFSATIRGQNTLDTTLNLDPAVGIYVDGVYIGPEIGNGTALNFDDAAGVEVLKGPQGTFYGRNTSGGAIKLDHVVPEYKVEGWATLEVGNYDYHKLAGAVTLPLVDQFATVRLYGRYSARDGYGWNPTQRVDIQDDKNYALAGTLRLDPAPGLRVVVRGSYDRDTSGGPSIRPVALADGTNLMTLAIALENGLPLQPNGSLSPATLAQARDLFFANAPQGFYDMTSRFPTTNRLKIWAVSGTIDYDVSDAIQIRSITGYRDLDTYRGVDFSGSSIVTNVATAQPLNYRQFTQELLLNGRTVDSKLKYTLGAFYLKAEGRDMARVVTAPILGVVFGAASPIPTGISIQNGEVDNRSYAAYAQMSYEVLPQLNLTGGIRYTKEHKDLTTHNQFLAGTYNPAEGFVDPLPSILNQTVFCSEQTQGIGDACSSFQPFSFSKVTYTASADYKIDDGILVYGKVSRGFRSGGGQLRLGGAGAPPFGPETVDDYEIGIKADLFDRHVRLNLALYNDDYKGLQKTFVQVVNGQVGAVVQNAGKARVRGVEFDAIFKPVEELTLNWSGAYTDAKYVDFRSPVTGADLSAQKFQGVADFVWTLSAAYKMPTSFGSIDANIAYWHTSDVPLDPDGGPSGFGDAPWNTQKAYGLLSARVAAQILDGQATIALWGKNLLDKEYYTFGTDLTKSLGHAISWGGTPRTYGLELTFRF